MQKPLLPTYDEQHIHGKCGSNLSCRNRLRSAPAPSLPPWRCDIVGAGPAENLAQKYLSSQHWSCLAIEASQGTRALGDGRGRGHWTASVAGKKNDASWNGKLLPCDMSLLQARSRRGNLGTEIADCVVTLPALVVSKATADNIQRRGQPLGRRRVGQSRTWTAGRDWQHHNPSAQLHWARCGSQLSKLRG